MTNMFTLPQERGELIAKLSARPAAPHGGMMGGSGEGRAEPGQSQAIWRTLAPRDDAPLVFYLHIPFCVSRCSFCGFYRNRADDAAIEEYVTRLLREIDRVADEGAFTAKDVDVVYFGGGTPTALSADQIRRVAGKLHERFRISPECEFTLEGRLFQFGDDKVRAALESGFNRFSFGVQSFETALRQSLGRRLAREEILDRLARIKEICGDRVALVADLIYGLPGQTQADWMEKNVKVTVLESALDAVDLYSLKTIPGTPLAKRLAEEGAWSEEERIARHAEASDYLQSLGWRQLSTTHWGRNALERNLYNTYAKIGVDMVPFGCGAGGFLGGYSIMQEGSLEKYLSAVDAEEKPIAALVETPPMARDARRFIRMTDLGLFDPSQIPETDFTSILDNWEKAGVWTREDRATTRYRLTRLGEYYQPKLNSLLTGFHFASHASMADKLKFGAKMMMRKVIG